jgi:hypothetical protein
MLNTLSKKADSYYEQEGKLDRSPGDTINLDDETARVAEFGRRTGLRIQRATVGVQIPPLAPHPLIKNAHRQFEEKRDEG